MIDREEASSPITGETLIDFRRLVKLRKVTEAADVAPSSKSQRGRLLASCCLPKLLKDFLRDRRKFLEEGQKDAKITLLRHNNNVKPGKDSDDEKGESDFAQGKKLMRR